MRQIFGEIAWEKKLLVFFGALTIVILLGPFGTYNDLDIWQRSVFWVMVIGGVGFCMHIAMAVALSTAYLGPVGRILRLLVGATIGAFPGAAIVIFVNGVFRPPLINADDMPMIWLQVTIIGFVIGVVEYVDWRGTPAEQTTDRPVTTALHARLQAGPTANIISMSMQDHYVEVTTDAGKELVLLRFSEAVTEVGAIAGTRIHRSHWVADEHLQRMDKRGHRYFATLTDARELPVSDTYKDAVSDVLNRSA